MKNKKGFLLGEETLKIVIAVICIGFLVYFLTSMYFRTQGDEKLEQAEATLEHLIEEINAMKQGDVRAVEIYNPKGWVVVSWPYNNVRPKFCENLGWDNCICICDDIFYGGNLWSALPFTKNVPQRFSENSDEGICRETSQKITVENNGAQAPIKIDPIPLTLKISGGKITK